MHYPPPPHMKAPFPEDDYVKGDNFFFSVYVFSRNKAVHVDYFDFKVCLLLPFFIIISDQGNTLAVIFCGCNNILGLMVSCHAELSMDSDILTICDKNCSIAEQNLTIFNSYKDRID